MKDMKREKEATYKVWPMVGRMLRIMKEEQPIQIVRIVIYAFAAGLFPFMEIFLPKIAIGTIETYGKEATNPLIRAMLIFFCVAGILGFLSDFLLTVMKSTNMRIRLRYLATMSEKIQNMEYCYTEDSKFQEKYDKALNSCNNNSNGVEGTYNHIVEIPAKVITVIGMLILGCTLNPLVILMLVLHTAAIMWGSAKSHDYQYKRKEDQAKASRKLKYCRDTTNDFTFGKDIRIFNFRDRILRNYRAEIEADTRVIGDIKKKEWIYGFLGMGTMLITNIVMYGILIYESYHGMPISSFTMYVFLISVLMAAMIELGEYLTFIRNEGQYVFDFFKLMDTKLVTEGEIDELPKEMEIRFDHVWFKYPGTENYIYKDFSFTIQKGERLAIVGVNGAGKTTLVKLMCGLYAPTKGHIYINDIDLQEYKKETLYQMFGTVFQDFAVLAFPVKENVAASKEVDEARVKEVLESVGLGKKIESLPKGIDTMMLKIVDEEGTDLSGGERQKLAIARALYKDAPMVIMDEPTAALDALAEAEIYESFSNLVEGKTAVYISHRLASTKFCDKIALFDGDGVKEYGTHEELMEKKGTYYDMFVVQGKYYQEDAAV